MRARPRSEWLWVDAPEPRIVPQDLWERVQARLQQRAWAPGSHQGARPKYLLSGLLFCGECNGKYVIQQHRPGVQHYGCADHYDRGATVCGNGRLVRRDGMEQRVTDYIFGDLFAPDRLAYLESAVTAALERAQRQFSNTTVEHEVALKQARTELENIANAIRSGIITPTTKAMLEDAERRVTFCNERFERLDGRRRPWCLCDPSSNATCAAYWSQT